MRHEIDGRTQRCRRCQLAASDIYALDARECKGGDPREPRVEPGMWRPGDPIGVRGSITTIEAGTVEIA